MLLVLLAVTVVRFAQWRCCEVTASFVKTRSVLCSSQNANIIPIAEPDLVFCGSQQHSVACRFSS